MVDITQLLNAVDAGDPHAAAQLLPLVYDELRKLAAARMAREKPGQTLDATGLVHEAYLRLIGPADDNRWDGRGHFFSAAAEAMRRILVENARRKRSIKHGGGRLRQPLRDDHVAQPEADEQLLAIDEALAKLAAKDRAKAELVRLRFFAGCTIDQAARVLGIAPATAERWWSYARAWLHQEINRDAEAIGPERKKTGME